MCCHERSSGTEQQDSFLGSTQTFVFLFYEMAVLKKSFNFLNSCHWAGSASNTGGARSDVVGKQAGFVSDEFLLLLSIFPLMRSCVGLKLVKYRTCFCMELRT